VTAHPRKAAAIELKLELVPVPVRDIDRAKAFYADQLGFNVDHDVPPRRRRRVRRT
jgi:catechol 2,3-dioxygenase-like lactoylglutathione lyase family enzyme